MLLSSRRSILARLCVFLALLWGTAAQAVITVPQAACADVGVLSGAVHVTFSSGVAAGSMVAVVGMGTANFTLTFTDDKGDTYTDSGFGALNDVATVGAASKLGAFLTATAGATTFTLTYGSAVSFGDICAWEIAGLTSPSFDKVVNATGSTATADSGASGALTSSSEAAVGYGVTSGGFTAAGSGWTQDAITTTTGSLGEHRILSSNASLDATGATSGTWRMWLATFKGTGGGGPTCPMTRSLMGVGC